MFYNGSKDDFIKFLKENNFNVKSDLKNILVQGKNKSLTVNLFYNRNIQVQQNNNEKEEIKFKELFETFNKGGGKTKQTKGKNPYNIYIVHGHDQTARDNLELILYKKFPGRINTVISENATTRGLTLLDGIIEDTKDIDFAFVLLTPDDVGYSKNDGESKASLRARQNVIFEMGLLYGRYPKDKIMILYKDGVEIPSDISGVIYKKYNNKINEIKQDIENELEQALFKGK